MSFMVGKAEQKQQYMTLLMQMKCAVMLAHSFLLSLLLLSGASQQCSDDITFFITTPPYLEGLRGSCVLIPCNFSITEGPGLDHNSRIDGIWLINRATSKETFVFNSNEESNKYPMKLAGNMSDSNCSTLFSNLEPRYTERYFFRIENGKYKSYACDSLQINVTDSPPKPTVSISGVQKEKETVDITCTALTPCPQSPPTLIWNLPQQPKITRDQNKDGTFTSKIQHAITLSDRHDGLTIQCKASYPVDIGNGMALSERNLTLSVLYAPKNTTARVSPSAEVSAGTFVNLSCSSQANPPVRLFTWFWIGSEGAVNVSVGDLFRVNVTERGEYYCEARNQLGAGTSQRITLIVQGTFEVSVVWSIIIAGTVGLVLLTGLVVYFCWLRSVERSQRRADEDLVNGESKVNEDIHYGEIHFSKGSPDSVEVFGGQAETVYSQIKVSRVGPSGGVQAQVESS